MENIPNNPDVPVTSAVLNAVLKAEFGKFEERLDKKLDRLLSDQANVILEAVGGTMEKKLDEKFDPVISKLDGIMKGVIPSQNAAWHSRTQMNAATPRPSPLPTALAMNRMLETRSCQASQRALRAFRVHVVARTRQ